MTQRPNDVAIIGMSCIFPGAGDLDSYWSNIVAGRDGISDVPESRWESTFYDPESSAVDRIYCRRGGFVDDFARFDAMHWGVMPVAAKEGEPDQLLTLEVTARALKDAGYADRDFPRESTGVILGRGGYLNRGMARLVQRVRSGEEFIGNLRTVVPALTDEQAEIIKQDFLAGLGHHGPDTVIGLVPNLVASRVANRLDLNGPSYAVDAACASSLIAVDRAMSDLVTRRSDMVIAGGVHICHDVSFWSVFCQLGALSRSGQIRPFDRRADGILMGEGVGVVVLKRLDDAERDGDRIYAVVRGVGVASDGRETSLMLPGQRGQALALSRAWDMAQLDPRAPGSIGLVEAHGTGTPAGDTSEVATLTRIFGPEQGGSSRAGLGSVKSMIGHAMPAAGIAGLIKAVLALWHETLPPTLHCDDPREELAASRFRTIAQAEPWDESAPGVPRRAAVNAFGFGGINAHVVLEEHLGSKSRSTVARAPSPEKVLMLAAADATGLLNVLRGSGDHDAEGACRLAVFDPTPERIEKAVKIIERGQPFRDRKGYIWFSPRGLTSDGGRVAFLFPGVDADFRPRIEDVAHWAGRSFIESADASELERTGVGIILVNRLLCEVLGEVGIHPDFVAGHSIGEWSAMIAAKVIPGDAVDDLLSRLEPGQLVVSGVVFAAVGAGAERIKPIIDQFEEVHVSHDNCPHQSIVCGPEAEVDATVAQLLESGVLSQKLSFQSGFHSPHFAQFLQPIREDIEGLSIQPASTPIWSATTCSPYPCEKDAVHSLFTEHLVQPVRFRELTQNLWDEGARIFVQVGTGSLVGFADDTLKGKEHLAISANVPQRTGMEQLQRLAAALWVEGVSFQHERLLLPSALPEIQPPMQLNLGAPLIRLKTSVAIDPSSRVVVPPDGELGPVMAAVMENLAAIESSQSDVLAAFEAGETTGHEPLQPLVSEVRQTSFSLSLDTWPELEDHCFFRQPAGWPDSRDGFPVVPMTASLALMMDAARESSAGRVVVGIENVRAYRWMAADTDREISVEARPDGEDRVHVRIGDFNEGTVVLASEYPDAPAADFTPAADEEIPMTAAQVYEDRWMFHGPRYQGIEELIGVGERSVRGVIEALPARGALLDNAGQLMGLWIMLNCETDRMAMPVMIESIRFFGPDPGSRQRFECQVSIRSLGKRQVVADIELSHGGHLWARIKGWVDHRFQTDDRIWPVMFTPERKGLAREHPIIPNCAITAVDFNERNMVDYMAGRFLNREQFASYAALESAEQKRWLYGRIAAKDAVRFFLWGGGAGDIYPIEVEIEDDSSGRPVVRVPGGEDLRISIAHKDNVAIALVSEGRDIGVDIERAGGRGGESEQADLTAEERQFLPEENRAEWATRFWVAKEAVNKALGKESDSHSQSRRITGIDGERLLVGGVWVHTIQDGEFVIGWTP